MSVRVSLPMSRLLPLLCCAGASLALAACTPGRDADAVFADDVDDVDDVVDSSAVANGEGEGEGEGEGALLAAEGEGEGAGDVVVAEGEGEGEGEGEPAGPCPPDVICVDALPFVAQGTTTGGTSRFAQYACGAQDETGPERIFRVALPGPGSLEVVLDDALEDAGSTDVDVHVLSAHDAATCLERGDRSAAAYFARPGVAWVVLDSFVRADGSVGDGAFSAQFSFVPASGEIGEVALVQAGASATVAQLAMRAYRNARGQGLTDSPIFSVIDFSLPSTQERLFIVDVDAGALLVRDRVSHGIGSNSAGDTRMATTFSNTPGSNQSSLGLARTAETYVGTHGLSLRLDGLEASNDAMRDRAIVVHGASYAEDDFVAQNGFLGRSNGCPAVAQSRSEGIVELIQQGTLMFSYFPDDAWLSTSPFVQEGP